MCDIARSCLADSYYISPLSDNQAVWANSLSNKTSLWFKKSLVWRNAYSVLWFSVLNIYQQQWNQCQEVFSHLQSHHCNVCSIPFHVQSFNIRVQGTLMTKYHLNSWGFFFFLEGGGRGRFDSVFIRLSTWRVFI